MSQFTSVLDSLHEAEYLLLACHVDPDPDCIGSMLALDWLCEQLGKRSLPLSHHPTLPQWRFLPRIDRIQLAGEPGAWCNEPWDTLVVVDCEVGRTGDAARWADHVKRVINIDHHVTNPGSGDVNLIVPDAAAAGEIVYDLIARSQFPIDIDVSQLLYAAIMADTGSFRFSNTTARSFEIASRLVHAGARPDRIAREIYDTRSWSYVKLLGRVLETLQRSEDGRVAWITLTQSMIEEEGARKDESEGFIQYPRMIEGVEVAVIFRELDTGQVKVGFRSWGRVDVSQIAQDLGGGGHTQASGCTLPGPLDQVLQEVIARVRKVTDRLAGDAT